MTPTDLAAALRALDSEGLAAVLNAAALCAGWRFFDDEGLELDDADDDFADAVHGADLACLPGGTAVRVTRRTCRPRSDVWHACAYWPSGDGPARRLSAPMSLDDAIEEAERLAVDVGWRLPWRPA